MTQNNLKIAITGGIGSGKSTVSKIIAEQGYSVLSCDEIYKSLLSDGSFLSRLFEEFGNVFDDKNCLDRKKLADIVFCDENKLKRLNDLTHPEIMRKALKQMSGEGAYFCEVPLLFEGGYEKYFDKVIVVLRDKDERVNSVAKRDNIAANEALQRISRQFDYDNAEFDKYYVINNTSEIYDLRKETVKILNQVFN
ncbi:MAG: dephospho-CoA kinase [Clostridia bacterium]|nr:dephospho-CoA kinase [Clostridia bacterium]